MSPREEIIQHSVEARLLKGDGSVRDGFRVAALPITRRVLDANIRNGVVRSRRKALVPIRCAVQAATRISPVPDSILELDGAGGRGISMSTATATP